MSNEPKTNQLRSTQWYRDCVLACLTVSIISAVIAIIIELVGIHHDTGYACDICSGWFLVTSIFYAFMATFRASKYFELRDAEQK